MAFARARRRKLLGRSGCRSASEDKRVSFGSSELGQVAGQVRHDEVWKGDVAMPGIGFGRAKDLAAAAQFGERSLDPDRPRDQVSVCASQRSQLAPSEAPEDG
jgi:hypothetical protein